MPRRRLDDDSLSDLVGLVYSAAADPAGWPLVLERFAEIMGATHTTFVAQDVASDRGTIAAAFRVDPSFQRSFGEHYCRVNVWMTRRKHLMVPGAVATGPTLCPESELLGSEWYNDWLRPQELFHLLGGIVLKDGPRTSVFSSFRPRRWPSWQPDEVGLLKRLLPHLHRALEIHQRLGELEAFKETAETALDRLPFGVILVDERGRPLATNRSAREILADDDGLSLSRGGLRTASPREMAALHGLIHAAATTGRGRGTEPGGTIAIHRPSLKPALTLLVTPLPAGRYLVGGRTALAAVFVGDPSKRLRTVPEALRQLYGLTSAESRLVTLMIAGKGVAASAEEAGISRLTAKTQLKTVFQKTGAARQSDLVRLILSGPAVLRNGGCD
jgi:DNA-binding CsgD family transcriptional regulator/PAS domain-containing protein